MQELERQFKADGGTFKEYKIGDLFKVSTPLKKFNANAIQFGTKYRYVVRTSQNNGIRGYLDEDEKYLNPANSISFGQDTATIFYQDQPYFTGDKIKVMEFLRSELNPTIACYLLAVMNRAFSTFQWGQSSFNENILRSVCVALPTSFNGEIDFDYMESYIHELQNESIIKLNNYLKLNGLENTELTQEEKDAVLQLRSGEVKWKEFKVGELFDIHPTNAYKLTNSHIFHDDGKNPVVTNSSVNNGITGYSNLSPTERGNMITYSDTTTSEGIFYQPDDFVGYPHVQGLYPKRDSDKWNEKTLLFFVSLFRKTAGGRFDYANKFNRTIASQMLVSLPITTNGKIDWDFMQNLISAESRLAIRGVIKWKDSIGNKSQTDG